MLLEVIFRIVQGTVKTALAPPLQKLDDLIAASQADPQGLKSPNQSGALRGAEAPLFHGAAGVIGA
jgi:hypothetical protein